MDETMQVILTNLETLIPLINGKLVSDLIHYRNVLTDEDWQNIKGQDGDSITENLLLAVGRRGPDALYALKEILVQIENFRAMEILNIGCSDKADCNDSGGCTGWADETAWCHFVDPSPETCSASGLQGKHDDGDGQAAACDVIAPRIHLTDGSMISRLIGSRSVRPKNQFQVKPGLEMRQGDNIYPMKSLPRGYCLLINNVDFQVFDQRGSAEEDATFLTQIFQQLGFQVNYFKNQRASSIEEIFRRYAKKEELKSHDAFVCILMSHGQKKDLIVGSDGRFVRLESLLACFNNYNCPNLINKPKLFFIQACRGDEFDYGTLDPRTTADAASIPGPVANTEHRDAIPTWSDMCIVHSTLQGYVALRHIESGSWFADALGWALIEHAGFKSLHEILMEVQNSMRRREGRGRTKQAIEVVWRGWIKSFYFNPGFYIS